MVWKERMQTAETLEQIGHSNNRYPLHYTD